MRRLDGRDGPAGTWVVVGTAATGARARVGIVRECVLGGGAAFGAGVIGGRLDISKCRERSRCDTPVKSRVCLAIISLYQYIDVQFNLHTICVVSMGTFKSMAIH